jgi:signal transduction histidine kinase
MSLSKKFLLFIFVINVLFFGLLYLLFNSIVPSAFSKVENDVVANTLTGIKNVFIQRQKSLSDVSCDYARWDDTYNFISDKNPDYIKSNYDTEDFFVSTSVDIVIITDLEGEVVFQTINPSMPSGIKESLLGELRGSIYKGSKLHNITPVTGPIFGLISTSSGPVVISSCSITDSSVSAESNGVLIMATVFDESELDKIRKITNTSINYLDLLTSNLELKDVASNLTDQDVQVTPISKSTLTGYVDVRDITDKQIGLIRAQVDRKVYLGFYDFINKLFFGLIILQVLVGVGLFTFYRIQIIYPLKKLISNFEEIRDKKDLTLRIRTRGFDEISSLKKVFNKMLDALELSELTLRHEKEGVSKQVTERTGELILERAKLMASLNSMINGFILLDPHGKVLIANYAMADILNVERDEWDIRKAQRQLNETFDIWINLQKCLLEKASVSVEDYEILGKYLSMYLTPVFDPNDPKTLIGALLVVTDITERKMLDRSKEEFLSIASHELRTPLTAIRGNTELLAKFYIGKIKDPEFSEMIGDIHASSIRLIQIVNDFLTTSKLEVGKINIMRERFNLIPVVNSVIRDTTELLKTKNLKIDFNPNEVLNANVYADRNLVREVLLNLLDNSIKFTDAGGINIKFRLNNVYLDIIVSDTGRGIPKENQKLLFKKFQQASDSIYTKDTYHGTGLGLYISKMICDKLGGRLFLESSEVGKGSTFVISLPQDLK